MEVLDPLHVGILGLFFLAAAAFFTGLIDSIAGGGGLISLPATLLMGVPPQLALGTGKFMAAMGTTASFITYARNGAVAWRFAAMGVFFSLTGSVMGSQAVLVIDNAVLGKIILCLLPVAALLTFMPIRKREDGKQTGKLSLYVITPLLCGSIGFYDGFFGPGTGSFILLGLHCLLGLGLVAASGTAKAFNLASNVSSLIVFILNGKVYYFIAVPMALANVAGSIVGSRLALRRGPVIIRRMLLVSLGLLFVSLIWRYAGG